MASTDARPVPKKNTAFRLAIEVRKNDGTLITSWAGADTELSQDFTTFADATNEATEIGTSGVGYIDLTAAEMNNDCVIVKTTVTNTDALPTITYLYPEEAGDIRTDVTQWKGSAPASLSDTDKVPVSVQHWSLAGIQTDITGNLTGTVGAVTGDVEGNVDGSVGSISGVSFPTNFGDMAIAATSGRVTANADQLNGRSLLGSGSITLNAVVGFSSGNHSDLSNASLGLNTVYNLGFATNYDQTNGRWIVRHAGTNQTLDDLDTAQDTQHATTQSAISGLNDPTAAEITDAVWDEAQTAHTTAGTFGSYLDAAVSGVSTGGVSAGDIADAVWDESTTGHTTAGTFGEQLKTDVDAILTDTNDLQTNQGNWLTATGFSTHSAADVWTVGTRTLTSFGTLASDTATAVWAAGTRTLTGFGTLVSDIWAAATRTLTAGTKDTEIDAILTDTGTTLPSQISGLNDLSSAQAQSAAEAALVAKHLDHLFDQAYNAASPPGSATSYLNAITEDDGTGKPQGTTAFLENAPAGGAGGDEALLLQSTTIATLASQTSFTLTAGSADDDAYNNAIAVITDQATSTQKAVAEVGNYVGSTKTIALKSDPGIFTMAVGDSIKLYAANVATSGLNGANTVTITVDDGSTAIEGAKVRVTKGGETDIKTTDVNGLVTFNLDDGTWTTAITAAGYSFSGTTLAVSGATTQTYSMTAITITPSPAGQATGYIDPVLDEMGDPETGVAFTLELVRAPGASGIAGDTKTRTANSSAVGGSARVEFDGLIHGAQYSITRGSGKAYKFVVPEVETFSMPSVIGEEVA